MKRAAANSRTRGSRNPRFSTDPKKRRKAAKTIQRGFRCWLARKKVQNAYRNQYIKASDDRTLIVYYRHKSTGNRYDKIPKFLGSMDLPGPTDRLAPAIYNPGDNDTSGAYLLLVTCNTFPLGNWPNLDPQHMDKDHDNLLNVLGHEFFGRFRSENIFSLKNPTSDEVVDAMNTLKRRCKGPNAWLVTFIATHVITVLAGEPKTNPNEDTYFAFQNTEWDPNPEVVAQSALSLGSFCKAMNEIRCARKTFILNYSHAPRPKVTMFTPPKTLYPPVNFLARLAKATKAPVIGSCATGFRADELLQYSPVEFLASNEYMSKEVKVTPFSTNKYPHNVAAAATIKDKDKPQLLPTITATATTTTTTSKAMPEHLVEKLMEDWLIKSLDALPSAVRPVEPLPIWQKLAEDKFKTRVVMPSKEQLDEYKSALFWWRVRSIGGSPYRYIVSRARESKRANLTAPAQVSIPNQDPVEGGAFTYFGKGLLQGFAGLASVPNEEQLVTVAQIYAQLHRFVKAQMEAANSARAKAREKAKQLKQRSNSKDEDESGEEVRDDGEDLDNKPLNQSPVLIVPPGMPQLIGNPVAFTIGPPAPPERPWIIEAGRNEVLLEWYNPSFEGAQPIKYRVFMKNETKNFNSWNLVYHPGDILTNTFLVRNLPLGVTCMFKVAAYNRGGWSKLSEESRAVKPGENLDPVSDADRWRRLREGGVLAILDRLDYAQHHGEDHRTGLRLLLGYGQNDMGFKNTAMCLRVAHTTMTALKRFTMDPKIAGYCFTLISWCLRSGRSERKVRSYLWRPENDFPTVLAEYVKRFRGEPLVMSGLLFLRGTGDMRKYVPALPEFDYQVLNQNKDPDVDSDEEAEENVDGEAEENKEV